MSSPAEDLIELVAVPPWRAGVALVLLSNCCFIRSRRDHGSQPCCHVGAQGGLSHRPWEKSGVRYVSCIWRTRHRSMTETLVVPGKARFRSLEGRSTAPSPRLARPANREWQPTASPRRTKHSWAESRQSRRRRSTPLGPTKSCPRSTWCANWNAVARIRLTART